MKNMSKEDSQIFTSLIFYLFTLTFMAFILISPIALYFDCKLVDALYTLWYIDITFSTIFATMLCKFYWLFSSAIRSIFQKWLIPIIPLEMSNKIICNLQFKLFSFFRNCSIVIVITYALVNLIFNNLFGLLCSYFNLLLSFLTWSVALIMTANGILIYSICLFEIITKVLAYIISKNSWKSHIHTEITNIKTFSK